LEDSNFKTPNHAGAERRERQRPKRRPGFVDALELRVNPKRLGTLFSFSSYINWRVLWGSSDLNWSESTTLSWLLQAYNKRAAIGAKRNATLVAVSDTAPVKQPRKSRRGLVPSNERPAAPFSTRTAPPANPKIKNKTPFPLKKRSFPTLCCAFQHPKAQTPPQ
jgi:hypothetical protein